MSLPNPLITATKGRLSGGPVFAGTRAPVQNLFDYLEAGDSLDEFLQDFPNITREHAVAVLEFARRAAISTARPADAAEQG
jgi:uncharacterized protein (DUF433 family)